MPTGPLLTTVADVLFTPDGDLVDGRIYIVNSQTFISPDGYEIPEGTTLTVPVVAGVFSIGLVPNINATPAGTSYSVQVQCTSQFFREVWIVPITPNPSHLDDVRALQAPIPALSIPIDQILPPSDAIPGQALVWTSNGWITSASVGTFTPFSLITTETNDSAIMTVKAGAEIIPDPLLPGVISATDVNGVNVHAIGPLHAGQVAIVQPDLSVAFADPLVQGIQAEGTTVSTINPVLIAGKDGSGNLKTLVLDSSGRPTVNVNGSVVVTQSTGSNLHVQVDNFPSGGGNVTIVGPLDGGDVAVKVENFPATQTVDGTVDVASLPDVVVSNFPSTQTVVQATAANLKAQVVFASPQHVVVDSVPVTSVGIVSPVDGSNNVKTVVQNFPSNQNVTVTGVAATQDAADGVPNSLTQPSKAIQVAGWDGSNFRALHTDSFGNVFVSPVNAFVPGFVPDRQVAASISSAQEPQISTQGASTVTIQFGGTWTGIIKFEASTDGLTWFSATAYPLVQDTIQGGAGATECNAGLGETSQWVAPVGGFNLFRLRGATVTSGDADVVLEAGAGVQLTQVVQNDGTNLHVVVDGGSVNGQPLPVVLNSSRANIGTATLNANTSTTLTDFIPAINGIFTDIVSFIVTNSASFTTVVSLSDGTKTYQYALAGDGGIVINFPSPKPATSSNTKWQVSNSTGSACYYEAVYVKNQ